MSEKTQTKIMTPTAKKLTELRNESAQLSMKLVGLLGNKADLDGNIELTQRRLRDVNAVLEGYGLAQQEASELKMIADASDT